MRLVAPPSNSAPHLGQARSTQPTETFSEAPVAEIMLLNPSHCPQGAPSMSHHSGTREVADEPVVPSVGHSAATASSGSQGAGGNQCGGCPPSLLPLSGKKKLGGTVNHPIVWETHCYHSATIRLQ